MLLVIFKINIFKEPIAQCELLQKTPPANQTTSYNVTWNVQFLAMNTIKHFSQALKRN